MAEIRKHTLNLEAALTVITIKHDAEGMIVTETHKAVDGNLLAEKLEALKIFLFSSIKTYALFEYLIENNRFPAFSNVFVVLRIYLTILITVASGKRSFSKLKLIKMYLRSTVSQERLDTLALLSIKTRLLNLLTLNIFCNIL